MKKLVMTIQWLTSVFYHAQAWLIHVYINHGRYGDKPRLVGTDPSGLSLSATAKAWRSKSGGRSSNFSMPVQCSKPKNSAVSVKFNHDEWFTMVAIRLN